jgi:kynureninase
MARVDTLLGPAVEIVTPREAARRGSQVSLRFGEGYAVMQAMISKGVIGDFRAPDIMRFGFSPLYSTYTEVWDGAEVLRRCVESEPWREERFTIRAAVT